MELRFTKLSTSEVEILQDLAGFPHIIAETLGPQKIENDKELIKA